MKFSFIKAAILGLAVTTGIAACSTHSTDGGPSPSESASGGEQTGQVGYELRLGRTTHINQASYTITCPGGFSQSGTIDVSKLRELEGSIPNLPPGGPCTLNITANSTNGNVTCSGSKSGLTVTCPGNRPQDEDHFKITCTRNHVGREWGDDDWKENARTFFLGVEVNLVCAPADAGADACVPKTTCPTGDNCGTVSNGCGGTVNCGSCTLPQTCGGGTPSNPNVCGCTPTSTQCPAGDVCGTVNDSCGNPINCGSCEAGTCNTTTHQCSCVPDTCAAHGDNCGPIPDGCGHTLDCGTCPAGQMCGAGTPPVPNHCGCSLITSCPAPDNCGVISNGCGGTINCGTCGTGSTCVNNVCSVCTPATTCPTGDNCGTVSDGCGGTLTCGTMAGGCQAGFVCTANKCVCNPITTCPAGDTCGTVSDGCGGTISCGQCTTPPNTTCTANKCVCTPQTSCPAGDNCGTLSDGCTGTISCGPACTGAQQQCLSNKCTCVPATTCPAGVSCGSAPNGCGGTIASCGTCPAGTTCDPTGTKCNTTCVPATCASLGDTCGTNIPDGCGGTIASCGTCTGAQQQCQNNKCVCVPSTCPANSCGTMPDGCGGTLSCGQCTTPPNTTCTGNQCVCTPITTCPAGDNCNTIPNNCGGTVTCGTLNGACPAGSTCNGNTCVCTPSTAACGTNTCGTAPDGCGGTANCGPNAGGCPTGQTCSIPAGQTAGTCGATDLCSPTIASNTTMTCIGQQDKKTSPPSTLCSACVASNGCYDPTLQGGTCELVTGNATLLSGTVNDGGPTCAQVFTPLTAPISERSICLDVLSTIFTSKCGATLQLTPCLCGTTDPTQCTAGAVIPNGPAYNEYACDFGSTSGATINTITTDFIVPTFGAGMANSVAQCAGAFGCDCF
jgi:hypothetical protein